MKIRVVTNCHKPEPIGGGEMSTAYIISMLLDAGHEVILHPTDQIGGAYPVDARCSVGQRFPQTIETECDVLFYYANNFCLQTERHAGRWEKFFAGSRRRVMCLNWGIGDSTGTWFMRAWDEVIFLSTALAKQCSPRSISIHAPAVNIMPFRSSFVDYSKPVFVRHGKANKWSNDTPVICEAIKAELPDAQFRFMGCPERLIAECHHRGFGDSVWSISEWAVEPPRFLWHGSCFLHPLPIDFTDQGPRVIVEAMAAALPVIADNRDGAKDRVTPDTGWLCNSIAHYRAAARQIAQNPGILRQKGQCAEARAIDEFNPQWWVDHIIS